MSKKKARSPTALPPRGGMSLAMKPDERDYFHAAARSAGFDNTSAWMLVHLRNEAERILGTKSPALKLNDNKKH